MENQPPVAQGPDLPARPEKVLSETQKVAAILAIIVVFVLIITALTAAFNGPADNTRVKIVVKCSGSWVGTYGDPGSIISWEGTGDDSVTFIRSSANSTVIANVIATGATTSERVITLQITTLSGQVLREVTSEFGIAGLAWTPYNVD